MTNFRAVIFDLDGTLLDSLADIAQAANRVLDQNRYPTHPVAAYRYFVGDGVRMLFARALPNDRSQDEVLEQCASQFVEAYESSWNDKTRPYDGILPLLGELNSRNVPLAVLSNKPESFTVRCVEEYFSDYAFHDVRGQRDDVPRKPDPTSALQIASGLRLRSSAVVYVGDTATDMKTAGAANMYPVGVTWGFRPRAELEAHGAQRLLDHPSGLLALFR